ncbi:MAG: hypothetical protein IJG52_04770 [Lachnospiraceae bacterium]|nr:hypothetical protein [Lachnospiraceae bacterium]
MIDTRYELACGRIASIPEEEETAPAFREFFAQAAQFLLAADEVLRAVTQDPSPQAPAALLRERSGALFRDLTPAFYPGSYLNPDHTSRLFGDSTGPVAAALFRELRTCIPFACRGEKERILIRMELFLEIYTCFATAFREEGGEASCGDLRTIIQYYLGDYAYDEALSSDRDRQEGAAFLKALRRSGALGDPAYPYRFGFYVSREDEEEAAAFLRLSDGQLREMAGTLADRLTEETGAAEGDAVELSFAVSKAPAAAYLLEELERRGIRALLPCGERTLFDLPAGACPDRGYHGTCPDPRYACDHREDIALFLDASLLGRMTGGKRAAREKAAGGRLRCAGIFRLDTGGDEKGTREEPSPCEMAPRLSRKQRKMLAPSS